ncbi:hypothetical protein ACP275_06G112200 [Erythranthe tilingii]
MMNNGVNNRNLSAPTPAEVAEHLKDICPEFGDLNVEEVLLMQESAFLYIENNKRNRGVGPPAYGHQSGNSSFVSRNEDESSSRASHENQLALDEALARALELGEDFNNLYVHENGVRTVDNRESTSRETPIRAESRNIRQDEFDPDTMTYEELQSLGESVGSESRGLSADLISRLPTFKYKIGLFSKKKKKEKVCDMLCRIQEWSQVDNFALCTPVSFTVHHSLVAAKQAMPDLSEGGARRVATSISSIDAHLIFRGIIMVIYMTKSTQFSG